MKVLIIGSEGFIGSNLVKHFSLTRHDIYTADIVLKQDEKYFLINPQSSDFSFIFLDNNFDVCINATGAANVQLSYAYSFLDFTLNSVNVYSILHSISTYNPACKFINFSSAAVYGNPAQLPVQESTVIKPLSPYGYHKWYSEEICREFHNFFDIPTLSLRIFSAYGPGLKKQLFWDLYKKALCSKSNNNQILLFGTGKETRDFIYIEDLCKAVEIIMQHAVFNGNSVNVASGNEISIKEAATSFISFIDNSINIQFNKQEKKGDPLRWKADISILTSLGFSTSISLKDGLFQTVEWLKGNI